MQSSFTLNLQRRWTADSDRRILLPNVLPYVGMCFSGHLPYDTAIFLDATILLFWSTHAVVLRRIARGLTRSSNCKRSGWDR